MEEHNLRSGLIRPFGRHFQNAKAGALERHKQVDVERHVGNAQIRMNFFDCLAPHYFRAALCVVDVHPKQQLHDEMKRAAGKLPMTGL
jgi:hypothetical protein